MRYVFFLIFVFTLSLQVGIAQVPSANAYFLGAESCRRCQAELYEGWRQHAWQMLCVIPEFIQRQ